MPFIGALIGSAFGALVVMSVLYTTVKELMEDELKSFSIDDEVFKTAMGYKQEADMYKRHYEDLCKSYTELLDKYEELYKQKGE